MKKRIFIALCVLVALAYPAFAVTAGDVLDKMPSKEMSVFVGGMIEMAIYAASDHGKATKRSECILNWYYKNDGKGQRLILATFDRYRDQEAAALLNVLIERQCSK